MSGAIDKVKHALHMDKDKSATHNTAGTTHNTAGTTYNTTSGTAEGVHGPHSSRVANAADPRIDSDRDGSRNAGAAYSGQTGQTTTGGGLTGTSHNNAQTVGGRDQYASGHNTSLGNAIDPNTGSGFGSTGNRDGTQFGNSAGGYTGTHGGISNSTNAGPHNSNLANKADPRVDSDLDSTGNRHGATNHGLFGGSGTHATPGSGTAQNTAGPHNSDLMNKADPRVDADLDGSKTYGGNRTRT